MPTEDVPARRHGQRREVFSRLDAEGALKGIVLMRGVSKTLFRELIADCIITYRESGKRSLRSRAEEYGFGRLIDPPKDVLASLRKVQELGIPRLTRAAEDTLGGCNVAALLVKIYPRPITLQRMRALHLLLSLTAIFRRLVQQREKRRLVRRLDRLENAYTTSQEEVSHTRRSDYLDWNLPRILKVAGVTSSARGERKGVQSHWRFEKNIQRAGGIEKADCTALYLMSTDPELKRFRPEYEPYLIEDGAIVAATPKGIRVTWTDNPIIRPASTEEIERHLENHGRRFFRSLPPRS